MNTQEQIPDNTNVITEEEAVENPTLNELVEKTSALKEWLVGYVGEKTNPEGNAVTVENIVEVMANEFPEFLMAVAEENWIRGYQQALHDVDENTENMLRERVPQEDENG